MAMYVIRREDKLLLVFRPNLITKHQLRSFFGDRVRGALYLRREWKQNLLTLFRSRQNQTITVDSKSLDAIEFARLATDPSRPFRTAAIF